MFLGIFKSADEVNVAIPKTATNCTMYVRHSKADSNIPGASRVISPEGLKLCRNVRNDYFLLINFLQERFGNASFVHSRFVRALLTGWEIFGPTKYTEDPRISLVLSLMKIKDDWFKKMKAAKKSVNEMILAVHNDLALLTGQPYDKRMEELYDFFTEIKEDSRLTVGIGHEPEPTLLFLKKRLIYENDAGLAECQAYIVYTDDERNIVGTAKFCPPATIK